MSRKLERLKDKARVASSQDTSIVKDYLFVLLTTPTTSLQDKITSSNSKEQLSSEKPVEVTDLENDVQKQGGKNLPSKPPSPQNGEKSTNKSLSFNRNEQTGIIGPGYVAPPDQTAPKPKTMVIPLKNGQKTAISVRPLPKSVGFKWPSAKQKLVNSTTDQTGQDAGVYCNPDIPSQVGFFLKRISKTNYFLKLLHALVENCAPVKINIFVLFRS